MAIVGQILMIFPVDPHEISILIKWSVLVSNCGYWVTGGSFGWDFVSGSVLGDTGWSVHGDFGWFYSGTESVKNNTGWYFVIREK